MTFTQPVVQKPAISTKQDPFQTSLIDLRSADMADRAQLNSLTDEYQSLQTGTQNAVDMSASRTNRSPELSTLVSARQKLESQQQENKGVQKEFSGLADDATIYKLVGPVLLKQDTTEAKSTVDGRLSYIEQEMYVLCVPPSLATTARRSPLVLTFI